MPLPASLPATRCANSVGHVALLTARVLYLCFRSLAILWEFSESEVGRNLPGTLETYDGGLSQGAAQLGPESAGPSAAALQDFKMRRRNIPQQTMPSSSGTNALKCVKIFKKTVKMVLIYCTVC